MFEEYIGKHLAQRHKAIGQKYAQAHGYSELLGPNAYGISFKDEGEHYLLFRLHFKRDLLLVNGRNVPGRNIKTIQEAEVVGAGYTPE